VFHIGDVTAVLEKRLLDDATVEKKELTVLAVAQGEDIYIDRTKLQKSKLKPSDSKRILESDRRFLCSNITVIAHELAHVMHQTIDNTKEHAERQLDITAQIMNRIF
jgi:ribonuclease HII